MKINTTNPKTPAAELLAPMDAYTVPRNYVSVGQIYLYDNPLLREPLRLSEMVLRCILVNFWCSSPQNSSGVPANRLIRVSLTPAAVVNLASLQKRR